MHAPPGGSTSIDLGGSGYERPVPLVRVAPVVVIEAPPAPPTAEEEAAAGTGMLSELCASSVQSVCVLC